MDTACTLCNLPLPCPTSILLRFSGEAKIKRARRKEMTREKKSELQRICSIHLLTADYIRIEETISRKIRLMTCGNESITMG